MGMSFLDEFPGQNYAKYALEREANGEVVTFSGAHDSL